VAKHPSAAKRHRQSLRRRARNQQVKSRIRTLIKKLRGAIAKQEKEAAAAQLRDVNRELDKAVKKGVLKRNTASRYLARLSRAVHRIGASA
jgi:small subunit ribosomal protein S20